MNATFDICLRTSRTNLHSFTRVVISKKCVLILLACFPRDFVNVLTFIIRCCTGVFVHDVAN